MDSEMPDYSAGKIAFLFLSSSPFHVLEIRERVLLAGSDHLNET
jgi:hypothetical protein